MTIVTDNHNALPIGYQSQEYRILSILGQGEFGITYLAKDIKLHNKVEYLALGLELFFQEAYTLASFQHPNIVQV